MGSAFVHGFFLALGLILPLGPQNAFVLSQAAAHSRYRAAVPVVITASLADTLLIMAAVSGVSFILFAIPALRAILTILAVAFMVWMGWNSWRDRPAARFADAEESAWPLARRVRYSVSVSLLNPHAIMDTVLVIGGGAALYPVWDQKAVYAVAAVLVSWLWFFFLSLAGRGIRRVGGNPRVLLWLNRVSAFIMWAIAFAYALQLLSSHLV